MGDSRQELYHHSATMRAPSPTSATEPGRLVRSLSNRYCQCSSRCASRLRVIASIRSASPSNLTWLHGLSVANFEQFSVRTKTSLAWLGKDTTNPLTTDRSMIVSNTYHMTTSLSRLISALSADHLYHAILPRSLCDPTCLLQIG
jgi:hypothetical protein